MRKLTDNWLRFWMAWWLGLAVLWFAQGEPVIGAACSFLCGLNCGIFGERRLR